MKSETEKKYLKEDAALVVVTILTIPLTERNELIIYFLFFWNVSL